MNLRDLFLRIRALVARRRVERELDEELEFHIVIATACLIAVSLPTLRAARVDPIATLRKD